MKNCALASLCILALAGCTTSPIPKDYSGPIANVRDTALSETERRAQVFYVSRVDGQTVPNGLHESLRANAGRGFSMAPVPFLRPVPARKTTLELGARVIYGAPIQEMMNTATVYTAGRTVVVELESNKNYVVKGVLSADRKDVWLEESGTGKRID